MSQVKFYTGSDISKPTGSAGSIYVTEGTSYPRMYIGANKTPIGQQVDKLAIGSSITSVPDYSIVAGTNDKSVITNLIGSLASIGADVDKPVSSSPCSISYGAGTVVNTTGSNAIGVWNIVGVKGYYWNGKMTFNSDGGATFTLSSSQSSLSKVSSVDWVIGDTLYIIDNSHYPMCATIKSMSTSNGTVTITTTKLPFTSEASITLKTPQNKFICAFYRNKRINYNILGATLYENVCWSSRNGAVEFGWASTALGVENLVSGAGSLATGWNNWQASSFGIVSGKDNVSGYGDITGGTENTNLADNSLVVGKNNKLELLTYTTIMGGRNNTYKGDASLIVGSTNTPTGKNILVAGNNNKGSAPDSIIAGNNNESNGESNLVVGVANKNHSTRSIVSGDDNSIWGYNNIVGGARNKVGTYSSGGDHLVIGADNLVYDGCWNNIVAGNNNININASNAIIAGEYASVNETTLFALGNGSSTDGPRNLFYIQKNGAVYGGVNSYTSASNAFAMGNATTANNSDSIALGTRTIANGVGSLAVGTDCVTGANIEGGAGPDNTDYGFGNDTEAGDFGKYAVALNGATHAKGNYSFAAGNRTQALNTGSVAFGNRTRSNGLYSATFGIGTNTNADYQTVVGKYNNLHRTALFVVGSGKSNATRKNILTVCETSINMFLDSSHSYSFSPDNMDLWLPNVGFNFDVYTEYGVETWYVSYTGNITWRQLVQAGFSLYSGTDWQQSYCPFKIDSKGFVIVDIYHGSEYYEDREGVGLYSHDVVYHDGTKVKANDIVYSNVGFKSFGGTIINM